MSKLEKVKQRILSIPSDYSYDEVNYLLKQIGFIESNLGKTSGSRVRFYREMDQKIIRFHKPHTKNILNKETIKDIVSTLIKSGDL